MATLTFNEAHHAEVLKMPRSTRWWRGLKALIEVGKNPGRTDKVLEAYEYINADTEGRRMGRFYQRPNAKRLLEENRTIDSQHVDFEALQALPEGTLGHEYATFMKERGLTPDLFAAEGQLSKQSYMVKRLRQTHDLWHVLTGYSTDVPGELELQAFTFAQLKIPSAAILVFFGILRVMITGPILVFKVARAFWRGRKAKVLADLPWEDHWAKPVGELQSELGLPKVQVEHYR